MLEELEKKNKRLHEALNKWPHNTEEGRRMRSHYGKRIESIQHFIQLEISRGGKYGNSSSDG